MSSGESNNTQDASNVATENVLPNSALDNQDDFEDPSIEISEDPSERNENDNGNPQIGGIEAATIPIPVNAVLAAHFEHPNAAATHGEIEREPIDPIWAPITEAQLTNYFADNTSVIETFGYPTVVCRTTMCEIQAVMNGRFQGSWFQLTQDLLSQPWATQFGENPVGYNFTISEQNGSTVIVQWIKRADTQN